MLKNYFKTAFRSLWKNKTQGFLNIAGLAIGMACAGLIFLWVEDEFGYDQTNLNKDRLFEIKINWTYVGNLYTMTSTPRPMAAAMKTEIPGIAQTARYSDGDVNLLFGFADKSFYAKGRYADPSIFDLFTLPFADGDAKHAFAQLNSIVITEKTAKKFFGNEKPVVGRRVKIDNKEDLLITGVVKDLPANSSLQFEWLAPYQLVERRNGASDHPWGSYSPMTFVMLEPGTSPASIDKQLTDFIHRKDPEESSPAFLFPMRNWHLYDEFANGKITGGGRIRQVRMLSLIAWIILLIACINFMNLSTARSERRAKEVGVRKVMGANKLRLVGQFMGDALFMAMLGALLALILIWLLLPAFNQLMQKQLTLNLASPLHWAALLMIMFICGLVAGSYPSLYLSSFNPVTVLKGLKMKSGSAQFIRKTLVVIQFCVSIVFIICTLIVYRQIQYAKSRDLGFNKNNLIEINLQHQMANQFAVIKNELLASGLVERAAICDHSTLYDGNNTSGFTWNGKSPGQEISISVRFVSPEYFSTVGMHITEGRDFHEDGITDSTNIIITQSLANLIQKGRSIGEIIRASNTYDANGNSAFRVIGVVHDYVYGNMYGHAAPVIFFCKAPQDQTLIYLRIRASLRPEESLAKIQAIIKKNNPAYPFVYRYVDDQFNDLFQGEILMSRVAGIFATLAVVISCLGLFGLASFMAERRIKEIGIRKVLGASVANISSLLSRDFLKLVVLSCLLAFPIAGWIMHNWLLNYEYRVRIGWWIFFMAGFMGLLIALISISYQTIKAAIANPIKNLRTE